MVLCLIIFVYCLQRIIFSSGVGLFMGFLMGFKVSGVYF